MKFELEEKLASTTPRVRAANDAEREGRKGAYVRCCLALGLFLTIGATRSGSPVFAQTSASLRVPSVAMAATAKSQPAPAPSPVLSFKVYNYAHVRRWLLTNSEGIASAIFKEAGVETAWVDCPLSAVEVPKYPDCQSEMVRTYVALKILPRSMEIKLSAHGEPLGFALPCAEGRACDISVFYDRIADMATGEYHTDQILGHAIAHEAGHVLLGPDSHSRAGIMRAIWSPTDLQRMSLGLSLDFTDEQRRVLRTYLLRVDEN